MAEAKNAHAFHAFGFLWALTLLFSVLTDFGLEEAPGVYWLKALGIGAVLWLLLRPGSRPRFLFAAAVFVLTSISEMPNINNHGVSILFVNATCLAAWALLRRSDTSTFFGSIATVLRVEVLILYFWATVHKLNSGYLDTRISCATTQLERLHDRELFGVALGFVPTGPTMQLVAMYGTLVIEALIPLLLLFRGTRIPGVILATLFHFVLGLSYPVFSTMLYALYVLFLPEAFWSGLDRWWLGSRARRAALAVAAPATWGRLPRRLEWGLGGLAVLAVGYFAVRGAEGLPVLGLAFRYNTFAIYGLGILLLLFSALVFGKVPLFEHTGYAARRSKVLMLFPLLVFLNGLAPHLGLKSTQSYAMFSNLRVEGGGSNHLLLPAALQFWDNGRDLVTILGCSDPILHQLSRPSWGGARSNATFVSFIQRSKAQMQDAPPSWRLPYAALRQRISFLARRGERDIRLVYERGGVVHRIPNAESDPELSSFPYVKNKLLRLRAVPDIDEGSCMW